MSKALILLGASHKMAPIEIREKLAIPKARVPNALHDLLAHRDVHEALVVSTCNRTEIYVVGDPLSGGDRVRQVFSRVASVPSEQLSPCLYEKMEREAVSHMFSVAAGLDSMILGEVQILGQIREAFGTAQELGTIGKQIDTMVRKALEAGKRARNETEISTQAASVSYAAVELARKIFGDISRSTTLVVGAGEMAELVARTLADNGVKKNIFTNRTFSKSLEFAELFRGAAVPFEELDRQLGVADIVISSTEAPHHIIAPEAVKRALHARRGRPLFFIDLAVPRDIDPTVHKLEGAYLYNIDDLHAVVEANLKERASEVHKVRVIVDEEVEKYFAWRNSLMVQPTITALREHAEAIRQAELAKVAPKLKKLSDDERNAVNAATLAIINKLLHPTMNALKSGANNGHAQDYANAVRELFSLDLTNRE